LPPSPDSGCVFLIIAHFPPFCRIFGKFSGGPRLRLRTGFPDRLFLLDTTAAFFGKFREQGYCASLFLYVGTVKKRTDGWLQSLGLGEAFIRSVSRVKYLFPKICAVRQIRWEATLMWYALRSPDAFGKVMKSG